MDADLYLLIFSLIFGFFLIFAGMLFRYIEYGIPFMQSLTELWQGILDCFKEFRKNFIPVTKKVIGAILGYIKEKFPSIVNKIVELFRSDPEPAKQGLINPELEYYLQNAVSDYVSKSFEAEIGGAYYPIPSYVCASLYTKSAITEDVEAEIVWALTAKFREYMRAYGLNCPCFPVPYVQNNHIKVYIYYCEFETERQAYQSKINQIMQMRSDHAPLSEADKFETI